jgi:hypothetical protein
MEEAPSEDSFPRAESAVGDRAVGVGHDLSLSPLLRGIGA